jgi:DNA-binding NtrC family response regulator
MTLSTVPYALVVDDDPLIMMDTTSILEDAGFRFYEAMDGDEAKQILAANWESIILLFSDVDMPGETNGFALARYVAEHWPAIEIVIASGHVLPKTGDMPEKATFISKPFNKHMVHEHLREMLPDNKLPEPLKKAV